MTSAPCAPCHNKEFQRWQGSHHDLAMQVASPSTVLGEFNQTAINSGGKIVRFFRRDDKYWVNLRGPKGTPADFEVKYTFGAVPLQQYLVELPGGRFQALKIAWDSRKKNEGGQRWFDLAPEEANLNTDDPFHWTGPFYNWNSQCAACHSTALQRGYDVATDSYQTTWRDIDVGCEACHGPGANHAQWKGEENKRPKMPVDWSGTKLGKPAVEMNVCSPCHSRRSSIAPTTTADANFLDHFLPERLREGLYFADGQIEDEVYVYGSFVQSAMHARGVRCADCHDPHSLHLRAPGNALCVTCHNPGGNARFPTLAKKSYDSESHHHHKSASGSQCIECHMPARTYMQIDDRRDHGFRIPRPHLSADTGSPNVCTSCHADRDAFWATQAIAQWTDEAPKGHWSQIIAEARRGNVTQALGDLSAAAEIPGIVRATAIDLLAPARDAAAATVQRAARDRDPLVRAAAARALESLSPAKRPSTGLHLLRDAVRSVRVEAAYSLIELAADPPDGFAGDLKKSAAEYVETQELNADQPQPHHNLGTFWARQGNAAKAERAYRKAIEVGSYFTPAHVNLADLQRLGGDEKGCEQTLRKGLAVSPDSGDLQHALGLSLVRQGRIEEALFELERAATNTPDTPRYAYVYAIALHSRGNIHEGLRVMEETAKRHPNNIDVLSALAGMHKDLGNTDEADTYKKRIEGLSRGLH